MTSPDAHAAFSGSAVQKLGAQVSTSQLEAAPYLRGVTNVGAMRAFAVFIRAHRERVGPRGGPLYVLQSDFEKYGDNLPVGPDASLWRTLREVASLGSGRGEISGYVWDLITALIRPVVRDEDGTEFASLNEVAMGTPLVPVLGNVAVVPMDRAIPILTVC